MRRPGGAEEIKVPKTADKTQPEKVEMEWYVVHTLTGHENKVKTSIEKMAESNNLTPYLGRMLVPVEEEIRSSGGKRRIIKKKLYPGYVFIQMHLTDEMRQLVRQTSGVTSFVSPGSAPVPLLPTEVENLLQFTGEEAAVPKVAFNVGEAVIVNEGPLAEMSGKIVEVDAAREKLIVEISIFGRETPVELEFTQVDKL